MQAIEIEVDGAHNENLHFRPLMRSVRGRFDMSRIGEPMARVKAMEWTPIPSQRLGIDPDGIGYLTEPLHQPEYAPLKEKIEKLGMTLEPAVQKFLNIDLPSWQFWLKAAVDSTLANIVNGKLPDEIKGKPRMNYILADRSPTETDKLAAAITDQTVAFNRLTDAILKLVAEK